MNFWVVSEKMVRYGCSFEEAIGEILVIHKSWSAATVHRWIEEFFNIGGAGAPRRGAGSEGHRRAAVAATPARAHHHGEDCWVFDKMRRGAGLAPGGSRT